MAGRESCLLNSFSRKRGVEHGKCFFFPSLSISLEGTSKQSVCRYSRILSHLHASFTVSPRITNPMWCRVKAKTTRKEKKRRMKRTTMDGCLSCKYVKYVKNFCKCRGKIEVSCFSFQDHTFRASKMERAI